MNEKYVVEAADKLVATGLAKLGYVHMNIDDCWQVARDTGTGVLQEDQKAFPRGMKQLGKELHKRGLKFGLYTDRGQSYMSKAPRIGKTREA